MLSAIESHWALKRNCITACFTSFDWDDGSAFSRAADSSGILNGCNKIDTQGATPIRQPPRRLPFHQWELVKKLLDMLDRKIVEPATGPWSSPIVLVTKKEWYTTLLGRLSPSEQSHMKGCPSSPTYWWHIAYLIRSKLVFHHWPGKWLLASRDGPSWLGEDSIHHPIWFTSISSYAIWIV